MKFMSLYLAALLPCLVALNGAEAKTINFSSDVTPAQESHAVTSNGKGHLTASYNTVTKILKWHVPYAHLTGMATMAHFHGPAGAKQDAPVIIPIALQALPSPISGSAKLTVAQQKQLLSGQWYFNIHTQKYPGGEIRTQLVAR